MGLIPVILRLLRTGGGEVLFECPQSLLHKNPVQPCFPCVQTLLYFSPNRVGCIDMLGSLQYHRLEHNKLL